MKGICFTSPLVLAVLEGRKTQTRRLKALGKVGEKFYVKETWAVVIRPAHIATVLYRADNRTTRPSRWRSLRFMPEWASRCHIVLTDVRDEFLQDITDADALAEGIERPWSFRDGTHIFTPVRGAFALLWDSFYGVGAWAANPRVFVHTFKVVKEAKA